MNRFLLFTSIALLSLSIYSNDRSNISDTHIQIYSQKDLLMHIKNGKKVLFIDARESSEFEEGHIPGAINVTLRKINSNPNILSALNNSDIIIAYCLKDFRGYEVAKALKQAGISNAAIMKPFGLNGWERSGLPLAKNSAQSEKNAMERLVKCATDITLCIVGKS